MKQIELIGKRKPREKHFLREDGVCVAYLYNDNVHYLKDGKYEEINNTLVKKNGKYCNKSNSFKVQFEENMNNGIMCVEKDNHYLKFNLKNNKKSYANKINLKSKYSGGIKYNNVFDNVDLEYQIKPTKIKESIVIKNKASIKTKLEFDIDTDMELELLTDGSIRAISNQESFIIDSPYMIDSNNIKNSSVYYKLTKRGDIYSVALEFDYDWLNSDERVYPIYIDPTITIDQNASVQDTYIYNGDSNVDRNSQDILKVGVERINNVDRINRALIKFELPEIGTGSSIISARLGLYAYPGLEVWNFDNYQFQHLTIHQVTQDWNETDANWATMYNKFNSRIINWIYGGRSINNTDINPEDVDITELVQKWYSGEHNYGLMIKDLDELYVNQLVPAFFSKNNAIVGSQSPTPYLEITYKNFNGLENYLEYSQTSFFGGKYYTNLLTGNLVSEYDLIETISDKLPIALKLFYNTNDVVLNNNYGFGKGYKLNINQFINEVRDNDNNIIYLEYCDEDGTLHYFKPIRQYYDINTGEIVEESEENTYYDEDGINKKIIRDNLEYILKDNYGNSMHFSSYNSGWRLYKISDANGYEVIISYSNSSIIKVTDADNNEINISYSNNEIVFSTTNDTMRLYYTNNKISRISNSNIDIYCDYNNNDCLLNIRSVGDFKYNFIYYDEVPYRLRKATEYGLNNELGSSVELKYGLNLTTIKDDKNRISTYVFKSNGTLSSVSDMNENEDLNNAYGLNLLYGDFGQDKNKLLYSQNSVKWVNNLINDSSFEQGTQHFVNTSGVNISISTVEKRTGKKSLLLTNSLNGSIQKTISVKKGKKYTFSAYFKNDKEMSLCLQSNSDYDNTVIYPSSEFERYQVTVNVPDDGQGEYENIYIIIETSVTNTTAYIDDIQLEEGEVANYYNLIDNSDFSNGMNNWNVGATDPTTGNDLTGTYGSVVTFTNGKKALCINMNPKINTHFEYELPISGKKGDIYNISFWYKNCGINCFSDGIGEQTNNIIIAPDYENNQDGHCSFPSDSLNSNSSEWQFFTCLFEAEEDYNSISLVGWQNNNANELYITNVCLFRDIRSESIIYNENGKISEAYGYNNENIDLKYDKNNQIVKYTDSFGKTVKYEYDNTYFSKMIMSISKYGGSNQYEYNSNNYQTSCKYVNYGQNGDITDGLYKIRLKGTNNFLRNISNSLIMQEKVNFVDLWNINKIGDYYRINHSIINNLFLCAENGELVLDTYDSNKCLFELVENDNGSYSLKTSNSHLYVNFGNNLVLSNESDGSYNYEIYFEKNNYKLFFEKDFSYNNKKISNIFDTTNSEITYLYDESKNQLKETIDANGNSTKYSYNDKNQLVSRQYNKKRTNYLYTINNQLSEINSGNRKYNISYDDFFRIHQISFDNNILVTNSYDVNNGNLISQSFSNYSTIQKEYDYFDRVKKLTTDNNEYNYFYGKNGFLLKKKSLNNTFIYDYDFSNRLSSIFIDNMYRIKYSYDNNSNMTERIFNDSGDKYKFNYQFIDGSLLNEHDIYANNTLFGKVNYEYDDLGRLKKKTFDNNNDKTIEYDYNRFGNRASCIIKSVKIGNDKYNYKYDKLCNLTHIYYNDILQKKYKYNKYNALIEEVNYDRDEKIKYIYDYYGNVLCKKIYKLSSNKLINLIDYRYESNYLKDQITSYNGSSISYDELGNMTSFGSKSYSWVNGNELSEYGHGNFLTHFEYDDNGNRTLKVSNRGLEINYINEGDKVISENTIDYSIIYIYNDIDNLVGFIYNDGIPKLYYYVRNAQLDVIGIMDESHNIVGKYEYDAWGNIISICDGNGNDVSDMNEHIANINPYRYRGYYYDRETGLYYLKTRYYDPQLGRFISCDIELHDDAYGNNLYVYCGNNPISRIDIDGESFLLLLAFTVVVSTGISYVSNGIDNVKNKRDWNDGWESSLIRGAFNGLVDAVGIATGHPILSASINSTFNEMITYTDFGNHGQAKPVTADNIGKSILSIGTDILVDYAVSSYVDEKIVPRKASDPDFKKLSTTYTTKKAFKDVANKVVNETVSTAISAAVGAAASAIVAAAEAAAANRKQGFVGPKFQDSCPLGTNEGRFRTKVDPSKGIIHSLTPALAR